MALYEATARGILPGGETWANVFHFTSSEPQPVAADNIRTMLRAFYTRIRDHWGTGVRLTELLIKDVDTKETRQFTENIVGQMNGVNLPNEVALVISWQTAIRSRRTRGRTYLGGFTVTNNTGSVENAARPNDPLTSTVIAAAGTLIAVTAPARLVVYSRVNRTSREVSGGYVNNEWDTQRRRARGLAVQKLPLPA